MTKTVYVEGMGCENCEKYVKTTLEALEGVESAVVSKDTGTAVVELSADVPDEALKAAVEKDGFYTVTGVEEKTGGKYKVTLNIGGMMCEMCEMHVNKAVKKVCDAEDVTSSHTDGTTVIIADVNPDIERLKEAVKDAGYEVTGFQVESV